MTVPDLHVIHFAVPYPADYGGAIDSWNRLYALKQCGIRIALHCFVYGDFKPQPILKEVASTVDYYPRQLWPALFAKEMPFIVSSRKSPPLLKNLLRDDQPIFFDGIHTTAFLPELSGRKLFLRAHNIEYQYYHELSRDRSGIGALIYTRESNCLEAYEKRLARVFDVIFTISPGDQEWFSSQGGHTVFLPPFHGCTEVTTTTGHGGYLLYQGDLSIEINQNALLDLIHHLPSRQHYALVVTGKSGGRAFEQKIAGKTGIRREANVTGERMLQLIHGAHIIIIHSLHASGMKLKFFPALYHGKFVMATDTVRTHTDLDRAIHFYQRDHLGQEVEKVWQRDFTSEQLSERIVILSDQPDDMHKAREITRYL